MKKLHFFAAAALMVSMLAACGPKEPVEEPFALEGTCWFDGYEFFVGSADTITHSDSLFLFMGGNLHEGGYGFALQRLAADTFLLQPVPGTPMVAVGVAGDTVVLQGDGVLRTMLCLNPDDEADTLWQYDPGDLSPYDAYGRLLLRKRLDDLGGTYLDPKSGMTMQFVDTFLVRTTKDGKADTATFRIFYSFDMPSHTLIFSTGETLAYDITAQGLDLYTTKYYIAEEDFTQEKLRYRLVRE